MAAPGFSTTLDDLDGMAASGILLLSDPGAPRRDRRERPPDGQGTLLRGPDRAALRGLLRGAPAVKFAPDYVACVLNDVFEDAKAQFLVAADGDSLRAPGDARRAGHRLAGRRPRACRGARLHRSRRRSPGAVRRHLRGPVLLRRTADRGAVRRGRRRTAAHRTLAQRHRHDDVPHAPARDGAGADRRDARRCAGRCSTSRRGTPRTSFPRTLIRSRRSRRRSRIT